MTTHKNTILPIKFTYNGNGFETKALKHSYNQEMLYKIAMPSAVSAVQQCWISVNKKKEWNLIMGEVDQALVQQMITAIQTQEQSQAIHARAEQASTELKSA